MSNFDSTAGSGLQCAALMPSHNFGFNPKLSKLSQLILMRYDLLSEMGVSNRKKFSHIARVRQKVGSLIGYGNNLFHRSTLNSPAELASQISSSNA